MAKYSYEFKKQVVDAYLRGEGGYTYLAEKYGVKNRRQVLNWVHYYEQFGDSGLLKSRKNNDYSFDFKLSIVKSYLSGEASCRELALENGINNVIGPTELQQFFPNLLKSENQNGIITTVGKCGKKSSLDAILHR